MLAARAAPPPSGSATIQNDDKLLEAAIPSKVFKYVRNVTILFIPSLFVGEIFLFN